MRTIRTRFLLILLSLCATVAHAQASQPQPVSTPTPATVYVADQPLFAIHTGIGPFTAQERANAATQRLADLAKDVTTDPNSIALVQHETSTDIVSADLILTTITDADAQAAGQDRNRLANAYAGQIRAGLSKVRAEYNYKSLVLAGLYALAATLALVLILFVLARLAKALYRRIEQWHGTRIRGVRIQSLELISADRLMAFLLQGARLVRFAVTLVIFYFYIPLVFSFFPWTRTFGSTLLGYVLGPVAAGWKGFVFYIPSLLVVIVILFFTRLAIRVARFIFGELEQGTISWSGFYPEWAMPTYKIFQLFIVAFALILMFPYLPGSDSPAFKGISIFLGVLLSLGSSSAVANIVAGVILTYTRAFRIGDRVQIAETVGDVIEKTLLATTIQTIKNVRTTIPNSLVLGSHIINFSSSTAAAPLILHTSVTIGYDAPWRQIHELLITAASRTEGLLQEPKPFVFQTSLDDFYVAYEINAYTDHPSRMAVIYSALHQSIQDAFYEAGVEIMSPHFNAVRDGNAAAIPESYLPRGYRAPSFGVSATINRQTGTKHGAE